ncbi:uncharacterized protein BDW70DRAFT_46544 [Aspergillus foveolatus]|uniref:uncharacterized protein n=1 Tax=Aspergillus foveolatus TaxID=210207 RepID=UPI003CCE2A3D
MARFLLHAGADPNETPEQYARLPLAVDMGLYCVLKLLLERGADPTYVLPWSDKPLDNAVYKNYYRCAKLLLDAGALAVCETDDLTDMLYPLIVMDDDMAIAIAEKMATSGTPASWFTLHLESIIVKGLVQGFENHAQLIPQQAAAQCRARGDRFFASGLPECGLDAASLDYLQWAKDFDALCDLGSGIQTVSGTGAGTATATPTPTSSAEEADETETETDFDDVPIPASTADDATQTGFEEDEDVAEQSDSATSTVSSTPEDTPTPTPTADAASILSSSSSVIVLAGFLAYLGYAW